MDTAGFAPGPDHNLDDPNDWDTGEDLGHAVHPDPDDIDYEGMALFGDDQ